jgi:hypothetical protein
MSKIKITKHKNGLIIDPPIGISGVILRDWKARNESFIAEFKENALHGEWCELPVNDDGNKRVSLHLSDTINAGEEVENG